MSPAPSPLRSQQCKRDLTVLMAPEQHDPDLPAAAAADRVKRDICLCIYICVCPSDVCV